MSRPLPLRTVLVICLSATFGMTANAAPDGSLHRAARAGDAVQVAALLARGADPAAPDQHGETPLHLAARFARAEVIGLLLDAGAPVNAEDNAGQTPLHVLGTNARPDVAELEELIDALVQTLINAGADPTLLDAAGRPAWPHAREEGYADQPPGYPSYDEILATLQARVTQYPQLCRLFDIGPTQGASGRRVWALKITDNPDAEEDEPEVKWVANIHGDEVVGVMLVLNMIDYVLQNYPANARVRNLVENEELWFVPTMNPDGYMLNRRGNSRGVDLNRNFPEGTLGQPNTITGREQETANIMQWTWAHSFTLSVGYHGGALVVNYPFDNDGHGSTFSPTPDEDMFVYISEEYSRYNPPMWNGAGGFYHGITNGAAWYSISGGMQDWHYRYEGCNDVTIEVSLSKSPPWSQIPTFWNENRDSMLAWMETALIGVRGLVTDSRTNRPLDATVSVVGRNHPIYTDPDVGDYHRMLLPGTYQLRFEATGYDPVIRPVTVTAGPATRLDVRLGPGWLRGDMNCDDVVNFDDINPFVLALSNPAGYAAAYPQCDIMNGDVNGDGRVDFDDINPFVALLAGTH